MPVRGYPPSRDHFGETSRRSRFGSSGGIGGWLLVLCLLLTIINPAVLALAAATLVGGAVAPSALAVTFLSIRLLVASVGVAAGRALWHKRPGAVILAKTALMLFAVEAIARLSTRVSLSEAPPGTRLPYAIAIIVFNGGWFLYLEKSRRVHATYDLKSTGTPSNGV